MKSITEITSLIDDTVKDYLFSDAGSFFKSVTLHVSSEGDLIMTLWAKTGNENEDDDICDIHVFDPTDNIRNELAVKLSTLVSEKELELLYINSNLVFNTDYLDYDFGSEYWKFLYW